jgi:hypothetical protein
VKSTSENTIRISAVRNYPETGFWGVYDDVPEEASGQRSGLPVIHPQLQTRHELANDEEDSYSNLNGGRGTSGQVDVPPPTEPEMTTFW